MGKTLKGRGVVVSDGVSAEPDHEYFLTLIGRGYTQTKSKIMAGFSPKTKTKDIMASKGAMKAAKTRSEVGKVLDARKFTTVQQAREEIQQDPGHRFQDNATRLTEIRDDGDVPENVAISAIKEHNVMMGYNAPHQIQTENRSLTVELSLFSAEHLDYIAKHGLGGNFYEDGEHDTSVVSE